MAKKTDKQAKAVKKIEKVVRKAVDKGVSAEVVSATVEDTLGNMADVDTGDPNEPASKSTKARKRPTANKSTDVVLKRETNTKQLKSDSQKPSMKKLPGKRKPPTLTLKRDKNS